MKATHLERVSCRNQHDFLCNLVSSQIRFGTAYLREALTAHAENRHDYAELARNMALNAYATATRLAKQVNIAAPQSKIGAQLSAFGDEIRAISPVGPRPFREIA